MRGTIDQAIAYSSKEDSRDLAALDSTGAIFGFTEHGERPSNHQGARSDLAAVAALVSTGASKRAVAEAFPREFIQFGRGIEHLQAVLQGRRDGPPEVFWFWGPTGTGKTRTAYSTCTIEVDGVAHDPFFKMATNKWWDGYEGQRDVIIDDFRRDFCTFAELLRLLDRYPLTVEIKGGTVSFTSRRIFITTPKNVEDTWEGRNVGDLEQLRRRITEVRFFAPAAVIPAMFAPGFIPPIV